MRVDPPPTLAPHPVLDGYYPEAAGRTRFVRGLFDASAPWYDRMTGIVSFGSGQRYRSEALVRHGVAPGMRLLDVATGTGVVAEAAVPLNGGGPGNLVGVDASFGMLREARQKGLTVVQGAGEVLPFRSKIFDLLTVGFALRHFADLHQAFSEYHRVLVPGGKLLILEITAPTSRPARLLLGAYMGGLVPFLVRVRTGSEDAAKCMSYYWETTRQCVPPDSILRALTSAGFREVRREMRLGIFSEYSGVV